MTSSREIRISAPAKVNLFLELHRKRPDGFHELETLMVALDLCDELVLRESDRSEGITLDAQWADGLLASHVGGESAFIPLPASEKNLAYKALALLQSRYAARDP